MRSRPLRDLCKLISSGGTPSRKHPEYFSAKSDGHLWVKSKELLDQPLSSTEERISDDGLRKSSAKYFPANTVLMAMYGANVGQLAWLRRPATVNQAVCAMVVDDEIADFRYVFYALLQTRDKLATQAQGAAQQNLNQGLIRNFEIPAPDLASQTKIASILAAYDDLIENNLRRIKILEEMAQNLYREWFVNFRFPGHRNVRIVDSELGKMPEGWSIKSFSDVAEFINGFAFKPRHWQNIGLPIVKIRELKRGITADTPRYHGRDIKEKFHITDGCVLFSWSASLDVYIWDDGDALLNQHLFNVIPKEGYTRLDIYFALYERMNEFRSRSLGTTMHHIKRSALKEVKLCLPRVELREQFDTHAQPIVHLVRNLRSKTTGLRNTRDLLLPRLISGELDVSELNIEIPEEAA